MDLSFKRILITSMLCVGLTYFLKLFPIFTPEKIVENEAPQTSKRIRRKPASIKLAGKPEVRPILGTSFKFKEQNGSAHEKSLPESPERNLAPELPQNYVSSDYSRPSGKYIPMEANAGRRGRRIAHTSESGGTTSETTSETTSGSNGGTPGGTNGGLPGGTNGGLPGGSTGGCNNGECDDPVESRFSVSQIAIREGKLILTGNNLSSIKSVRITGDSVSSTVTKISGTASEYIGRSLSGVSLIVGKIYNVIIADAHAQTTFPIEIELAPLSSAEDGYVMKWNDGLGQWVAAQDDNAGGGGTSVTAGTGIIENAGTISVDVGFGASQIPQFDGTGQLLFDTNSLVLDETNDLTFKQGTDNYSWKMDTNLLRLEHVDTNVPATITNILSIDEDTFEIFGKGVCYADGSNCTATSAPSYVSSTGPQFTVGYDVSNQTTISIAADGKTTFNAIGTAPSYNFTGGNLGVGATSAPTSKVTVKGTTADNTASSLNVTDSSDASLLFVRNDGYVGIGTTVPSFQLEVLKQNETAPSSTTDVLRIGKSGPAAWSSGSGVGLIFGQGYNNDGTMGGFSRIVSKMYTSGTDHSSLHFQTRVDGETAPADKMVISEDGYVGIGTSDPQANLEIRSANVASFRVESSINTYGPEMHFRSTAVSGRDWRLGSGQTANSAGVGKFFIQDFTAGVDRFVIDSAGNVGIGILNPGSRLDVGGTLEAAAGTEYGTKILPTINQSGTAGYTGVLVNVTETATGSGIKKLFDLQLNGTSVFSIDSAGAVYSATSTSGTTANFTSAGGNQLTFGYDSTNKTVAHVDSIGFTTFTANGAGAGYNFTGGKVGVGTAIPSEQLDVTGNAYVSGTVKTPALSNIADLTITADSDADTSGALIFKTGTDTRMTILNDGNVGIGAPAPTAKLHIAGISTGNMMASFLGLVNSSNTTAQYGVHNQVSFQPSGVSLSNLSGSTSIPTLHNSAVSVGTVSGHFSRIDQTASYTGVITSGRTYTASDPTLNGGNPIQNLTGFYANSFTNGNGITSGTVNNNGIVALGATSSAAIGGTITNTSGYFQLGSGSGAGTTTNYGVFITGNGGSGGTGTTTNYSLYNNSTAPNYIAGNVGIGTGTAGARLNVTGTVSAATGIEYGTKILPTINQSGTAGYTGLLVNVTETATGSGTKKLFDLQLNGVTVFSIDSAGAVYSATSTSGASATFTSAGGSQLTIGYDSTNRTVASVDNVGMTTFTANGTGAGYNFTGGKVGIGTAIPSEQLDVTGNAFVSGAVKSPELSNIGDLTLTADSDANATGALIFRTGSDDRMTILNDGNVGIGTTSPDSLLELESATGSNPSFQLSDQDVVHGLTGELPTNAILRIQNWGSIAGGAIIKGASDDGGVPGVALFGLIGVTDPTDAIPAVVLAGAKKNTNVIQPLGNAETVLQIRNGDIATGSKLMTVLGSGNVGIGTTDPKVGLHLAGMNLGVNVNGSGNNANTYVGTTQFIAGVNVSILPAGTYSSVAARWKVLFIGNWADDWIGGGSAPHAGWMEFTDQYPSRNINGRTITISKNASNEFVATSTSINSFAGMVIIAPNFGSGVGQNSIDVRGSINLGSDMILLNPFGKSFITGGNVGIGLTDPGEKLQVAGGDVLIHSDAAANTYALRLRGDATTGYGQIQGHANYGLVLQKDGGNVGIGTSGPTDILQVEKATSGGITEVFFKNSAASVIGNKMRLVLAPHSGFSPSIGPYIEGYDNVDTGLAFGTYNSGNQERMRITGAGKVVIGTTDPGLGKLKVQYEGASEIGLLLNNPTANNGASALAFQHNGTTVGTVTTHSTGTVYNTTSDRRLKENLKASNDGLKVLNQIKIWDYNFINDKDKVKQQGFVAQELYPLYPQAVTVGGDDPKTKPWTVDYGRLTPLIIKSLQELYQFVVNLITRQDESEKKMMALEKKYENLSRRPASVPAQEMELKRLREENALMKEYLCSKDPKAPFCLKKSKKF